MTYVCMYKMSTLKSSPGPVVNLMFKITNIVALLLLAALAHMGAG